MRGVETHKDRSKMEFHKMQISNHRFLKKKSSTTSKKKLGNNENSSQFANESIQTIVLMWWLFMSSAMKTAMKVAMHVEPIYHDNLEWYKDTTWRKFRVYSVSLRGWYRSTLRRSSTWNQLKVQLPHGGHLHCLMIKSSSGQKQKYMFTQILLSAWGRCRSTKKQTEDGQVKWQIFNWPLLPKNHWETIENWLSSSGIFY